MQNHPDQYAETPDGKLLIADGLNPVKVWDGLKATLEDAGLAAPDPSSGNPTIAIDGSLRGAILGDYQIYVRYVDEDGNPSNLSAGSLVTTINMAGVGISNVSNELPIKITCGSNHNLTTGCRVTVQDVQGCTAANGTWKVTVTSPTAFTLDDSNGDGTWVTSTGSWVSGVHQLTYGNIPVPTSAKVARKEVLRNTDGQFDTYYFDGATANLAATSGPDFVSILDDDGLATQEAVPLLGPDGQISADANAVPPDFMQCFAHHLGRMFACVNAVYKTGAVSVSNGSSTVTGIGTAWTASMVGRFLYALGATKPYQIIAVDTGLQTLTVSPLYDDSTDTYTSYSIRPAPAYRRQIWYTRSGYPQSWSPTYALDLQDDGDELTGIMATGSFIYFLERRHIHRLTFQTDPSVDGHVFPSGERGCINNRCWVTVEDKTFMLDDQGIHSFDGSEGSEAVSTPIQTFFELGEGFVSINWKAGDLFHAVNSPHEETVRWFVSMGSCTQPRHAIAYHTRLNRWWIEEFPQPILASCLGWQGSRRVVYLAGEARQTWILGRGQLDGIDPDTGTVAGTVSSAGVRSLSDGHASFPPGLAGLCVSIVKGRGQGQRRTIHASTATSLSLTKPWTTRPNATSVYQIGGVHWSYLSKRFEWVERDSEVKRRFAIFFQPDSTGAPAFFHLAMYLDSNPTAELMATTTKGELYEGTGGTAYSSKLAIDCSRARRPEGYAQLRMAGRRDLDFDGPREITLELQGVAGADGFGVSQIQLDGAQE
jgi:hypothetical protein